MSGVIGALLPLTLVLLMAPLRAPAALVCETVDGTTFLAVSPDSCPGDGSIDNTGLPAVLAVCVPEVSVQLELRCLGPGNADGLPAGTVQMLQPTDARRILLTSALTTLLSSYTDGQVDSEMIVQFEGRVISAGNCGSVVALIEDSIASLGDGSFAGCALSTPTTSQTTTATTTGTTSSTTTATATGTSTQTTSGTTSATTTQTTTPPRGRVSCEGL